SRGRGLFLGSDRDRHEDRAGQGRVGIATLSGDTEAQRRIENSPAPRTSHTTPRHQHLGFADRPRAFVFPVNSRLTAQPKTPTSVVVSVPLRLCVEILVFDPCPSRSSCP